MKQTDACEALASAENVFDACLGGLSDLRHNLDRPRWQAVLRALAETLRAGGRLHVTGVGKPEHLARYAAALFSATGAPATFLNATEAVHGSAGQVVPGDLVIAVSNSGTTHELLAAVEAVCALGGRLVAVTGNIRSPLAQRAEWVVEVPVGGEGGALGLAPRASAAAALVALAALSAGLETLLGFRRADFHARHPAGRLGELSRRPRGAS